MCKMGVSLARTVTKRYNKKKPTTVGGRTIGRVRMPSRIIFSFSWRRLTTHLATKMPRKKVIKMETVAVFSDIQMGE